MQTPDHIPATEEVAGGRYRSKCRCGDRGPIVASKIAALADAKAHVASAA